MQWQNVLLVSSIIVLLWEQNVDTYVNLSLCQNSQIDYILVSKASDVANFYVSDPDINYSDHWTLTIELSFTEILRYSAPSNKPPKFSLQQLRWNKADRGFYYLYTGSYLELLVSVVEKLNYDYQTGVISVSDACICMESTYHTVVSVLQSAAELFVPKCHKGFFKILVERRVEST